MWDFLRALVTWFADPAHWQGSAGVPVRVTQHLGYSLAATVLAVVIALPIGLWLGHTGRFGNLAINVSNVGRAVPSLGILILAFILAGIGFVPVLVALTALAIPPIITNSYVGIRAVEPEVVESAKGMGMTDLQVLARVEIPVALPLLMAGVRTSAVQVVATATLAAVISLGGLGRYIIDGFAVQDTVQIVAGGILVAVLALLLELALSRVQAVVVSSGLQARNQSAALSAKLSGGAG